MHIHLDTEISHFHIGVLLPQGMKKLGEIFYQDGKVVDELLNIAKVISSQSGSIQA